MLKILCYYVKGLLKDIVSENPHFDVDGFIMLLRERIYTQNVFARQFLVSWVSGCGQRVKFTFLR